MTDSIPRLRRVRFKDGRTIEVLRQPPKSRIAQDALAQSTKNCLSSKIGDDMVGFALVAWTDSGEIYVNFHNGGAALIAGQVPQFVKDILLAEQAVRWATE